EQIIKTKAEPGEPTEETEAREAIAAMNVVDGRKLVEHVERTGVFTYPFGLTSMPRGATNAEVAAITEAADYIRDVNDAVADLVLAEGVHQAVIGNYERSAGTLDAFAKGNYPPEPDVIRTPRSGIGLTLRVAVHLTPSPAANPLATPLATVEPAVNAWLADRLPDPSNVGCRVAFTNRGTGNSQTVFITQEQLGLQPIDLLYGIDTSPEQALNDLDDRILHYLHENEAPRYDQEIKILYIEREPGKITWFELQALLSSLRALITAARPLQPADLMRANDASKTQQTAVSLAKSRVKTPRDALQVLNPSLDVVVACTDNAAITIDAVLKKFAGTVE